MTVRDYMSTGVISANLKDGMRQTFYRMRERSVRHMPVLDDHEKLVGILSDRDLRRPDWVDSEENVAHYYLLDNSHFVEAAMSPDPKTVSADDDIADAVHILVKHRYGVLPVVDSDNHVIGMISAHDALRAFGDTLRG